MAVISLVGSLAVLDVLSAVGDVVAKLDAAIGAASTGRPPAALARPSPRASRDSGAPTPTPTPPPPVRVLSAEAFGALGDGRANDTAAIQDAIAAASAAGGGVVLLPPGTYRVRQVILAAGVSLRGSGAGETTIRAIGEPGLPTIAAKDVDAVGIASLKVEGRGVPGGAGDEILINLIDVSNARVSDVHIDRAQGIGLQVEGAGSSNGVYQDIRIANTFVRGNGFHGVAFWLYAGPHNNRISNLTTDTSDGPGLMLDAGTTVGSGVAVSDNTLTDITILRAARGPGGAAIIFAGASRNSLIGFRIEDAFAHDSVAISIQQDQTGVPADRNVIGSGVISQVGSSAFDLESASHNRIHDIAVRDIGLVAPARLIQLTATAVNAGEASRPTSGNVFRRLTLTQTLGNYHYGVRLDSTDVAVLRNRFEAIDWGTPLRGIVERIGPNSPLTGSEANVF